MIFRNSSYISTALLLALFSGFFLITTPQKTYAKTMYIKPVQELAVRRGQGIKYKIIAMVESGVAVEMLEQTNDYARVRLQNGKEGWIPKRFLDKELPPEEQLEKMQQENILLAKQTKDAMKKAAEATASLEETQAQLKSVLEERNKILEDYQQLQRDTTNVTQLKKSQQETSQLNAELSEQMISIKDENTVLKKEKNLDWFLAGAAVLIIGFLLGKIPSPNRKKRGYLL